MPDGTVAYGLLGGLAIALLVAAFTDLKRRQIDNWLTAGIALAAPLFWWAAGLGLSDIVWQIGIAALMFAACLIVFARGSMGGGDVKLLVALALWLPPLPYFQLLFMMAVVGGAMSVVAGARNIATEPGERGVRLLSVATTALWLLGSLYIVRVMNGARPFDFSAAAAGIAPAWLGMTLVYGALIGALIVLVAGARTIARHQKSRVPVPYGLAISVAGLWVLAIDFLPRLNGLLSAGPLG